MPVLEARSMGTRVVVADVPELIEAADGDYEVAQSTVEGLAGAILASLKRQRPETDQNEASNSYRAPILAMDSPTPRTTEMSRP